MGALAGGVRARAGAGRAGGVVGAPPHAAVGLEPVRARAARPRGCGSLRSSRAAIELLPVAAAVGVGGVVAAVAGAPLPAGGVGRGRGAARVRARRRSALALRCGPRACAPRAAARARASGPGSPGRASWSASARWPDGEPFVPMTADGRGRVPRREGRHLLIVGATGSGKTVSARRWLLARILADGVGGAGRRPEGRPRPGARPARGGARWSGGRSWSSIRATRARSAGTRCGARTPARS